MPEGLVLQASLSCPLVQLEGFSTDAFAPAPPEDVLGAGVLGSPAVPPLGEQADVGLRLYASALRMRG